MVTKLLRKAVPAPLRPPVHRTVLLLITFLRRQSSRIRRLRNRLRRRARRLCNRLGRIWWRSQLPSLTSPVYLGFRYKCPLCRGHFRKFLPCGHKHSVLKDANVVGAGYRLNCRCPRCRSRDKERLLYLYLVNETEVFDEHVRLLHVAPERNLSKEFSKHRNIDYLTADLNLNAGRGSVMVQMDITDIQYEDNSFDVTICCHVLEHVSDDRKAMSELYRTLKPGGWAILQVPVSFSLNSTFEDATLTTSEGREKAFGQADHVRLYARDYKDRLEQVGFSVNEFRWTTSSKYYGDSANRYGLNEDEIIYCASKPKNSTSLTVS
jgi:SAM-dependent methyltransferase